MAEIDLKGRRRGQLVATAYQAAKALLRKAGWGQAHIFHITPDVAIPMLQICRLARILILD
jgi:hypothetical protein